LGALTRLTALTRDEKESDAAREEREREREREKEMKRRRPRFAFYVSRGNAEVLYASGGKICIFI